MTAGTSDSSWFAVRATLLAKFRCHDFDVRGARILKRLSDDITGRRLTVATGFLNEVAPFERE
jgi:hypothetical protein